MEEGKGDVFYIDGLDEWPADLDGLRIQCKGTLGQVEHNEPLVNARGEYSAGMQGTQDILFGATFEKINK